MLREVALQDLDKILRWRNSPDVRQVMFTDHIITKDEHLSWWERVKKDNSRENLVYVWKGEDVGVVNFYDIDNSTGEYYWGFYLSDALNSQLTRMQIWQALEKEAIEYAFNDLNCKRLFCETFRFNQPVNEMHKRFGFKVVAIEKKSKGDKLEEVIIADLTPEIYYKKSSSSLATSSSQVVHVKSELANSTMVFTRLSKRCVFLGSANLGFFTETFRNKASDYGFEVVCTDIPYGQYMVQMSDAESEIRRNSHDYVVFIERIEDFVPVNDVLSDDVLPVLQKRWIEYLSFIRNARNKLSGTFLIANSTYINTWLSSLDPAASENKVIFQCIDKMNSQLSVLCEEMSDSYIIDLASLTQKVGRDVAHPGKYWYMARAPFSEYFNNALSQHLLGIILALEAKTARVIALDLDNTLWKGVIGDDGIEGIQVGGDYPGNAFKTIQNIFKSFQKRGIALALCSKNTEKIAFEVFEKHPDMVLDKDDLAAWRVNWLPKPDNLRDLSAELDLGLASFCFIDDNPLEREEVRASLPEVYVPEMPDEISEWPEYILNLPELAYISLTDEDRKKAEQYKVRSEIKRGERQSESREDFLKTLEMKLSVERLSERNQQRVLQLIKKTNQYNVTTRRHTEADIKSLLKQGECFAVRLKDRLGSDEIIGVLIVVYEYGNARIDTTLM